MILALDLGSTSFKAAALDEGLRLCGLGQRLIQYRFASGGQVELDMEEVCEGTRDAIREALKQAGARRTALRAVAVTSQAQTFTVTDAQARPRMPFISWQDTRAAQTCDYLRRSPAMRDFSRHCSFGALLPALQVCQLKHLRGTRPDLLDADARVVPLPAYLLQHWTGIAVIDDNLAAMSGLYSLAAGDWWPAALRVCGLRPGQLPRLRAIGAVAGCTTVGAAAFGLPKGIPVISAGNDQTAGAYAVKLGENHRLLITLGTAQVVYLCAKHRPRPHPALIRGPFPGSGYYRMAADGYGGNLINWAGTVLEGCGTAEAFFRQAERAQPGCRGLKLDPSEGLDAPSWRNIGLHHTAADFARSILECLARRVAGMLATLGIETGRTDALVAGGGSASPLWVRILSETLGTRLTVVQAQPFLGAARMASTALARISRHAVAVEDQTGTA